MTDKVAVIVEQLSQQNPFNGAEGLVDPPRPTEAAIPRDRPSVEQIPYIQQQISILTYNHLPRTFFSLEKHRSLQSILLTAKEALAEALPIRCLEATFVALHYTQCLRDVDRIPLSFKSEAKENTYRHIVLILRTRSTPSLYGALGLSRKSTLMYKPMTFHSLFEIVMEYKREYEVLGHELADIKLGIAITHDEHSKWDPCWRFIALKLSRYCEGTAGASGPAAEAPDAAPPSPVHNKAASPNTTATRRISAQTGVPSPPLSFEASSSAAHHAPPTTRGEGHLDHSGVGVLSDSHGSVASPSHPPRRTSSLGASTSILSPSTSSSAIGATQGRPDAANELYAPLARLLSNYTRVLPTICEQYYKTLPSVDASNRALRLCYMDLDTAEKDAGAENLRRLQYISELQSPLSPEARRVAAGRQLRSTKKERAHSKSPAAAASAGNGGSDVNTGTKRRLMSSHESRPAKRRSPASPALSTPDGKRHATTAVAAAGAGPAGTQQTRSPRAHLTLSSFQASAGSASTTRPSAQPASSSSLAVNSITLSAALADAGHGLRYPLSLESTTVDAQSICSSTSAERAATEGYVTPRDLNRCVAVEEAADLTDAPPPLTPRNYDARGPTTPYDAFLRTPSSTSDLFSGPRSPNDTMAAQPPLSP